MLTQLFPEPPCLPYLLNAAEGGKPGMALLDGRWRLLYSSGFTSGSLGGRRPGPSFGSSLVTLGQVFQDIYTGGLALHPPLPAALPAALPRRHLCSAHVVHGYAAVPIAAALP